MKILRGKKDFYVFEVPQGAKAYKISGTNYLCFRNKDNKWEVESLLPKNSKLVGLLSEINEELADGLVDRYGLSKGEYMFDDVFADEDITWGYRNYINNMTVQPFEFQTAKESLRSLFIANKFDMEKDYLIITLVDDITMTWQELARLLDNASWDIFQKYYGDDEPKYGFRELFPVICNRDELDTLLNKFKR